ncbi:MAG: lantibiotic dehydratase [Pseudonocardiaceae bacterium]
MLRATSRPTPFGLFAGVAPARFGRATHIRFGEQHQATARVDSEWLAAVITRLETCSELRRRLPVVLNNLAFVRDGRVVVGCQQQAGASSSTAPAEVSVRHTEAVETVMQAARSPILMADLVDKLRADFPTTSAPVIERMLAELVGQLRDTHPDLSRHTRARMPTTERDLRTAVANRMDGISVSARPLGVDLRVGCELVLPQVVAREAEAAAEVLTRLAPYPSGTPAWRDFHSRFLERYGMAALVPVREVLNIDTGLGFPETDRVQCCGRFCTVLGKSCPEFGYRVS